MISAIGLPLALLACAREKPITPRHLAADATREGDDIVVVVRDIPPGARIEAVELVGPEGPAVSTRDFAESRVESAPGYVAKPSIGVAITGGSSSGVKPSVSVGYGLTGGGPAYSSKRAVARLPIPDPQRYAEARGRWRVDVVYLDVVGDTRRLEFAAP